MCIDVENWGVIFWRHGPWIRHTHEDLKLVGSLWLRNNFAACRLFLYFPLISRPKVTVHVHQDLPVGIKPNKSPSKTSLGCFQYFLPLSHTKPTLLGSPAEYFKDKMWFLQVEQFCCLRRHALDSFIALACLMSMGVLTFSREMQNCCPGAVRGRLTPPLDPMFKRFSAKKQKTSFICKLHTQYSGSTKCALSFSRKFWINFLVLFGLFHSVTVFNGLHKSWRVWQALCIGNLLGMNIWWRHKESSVWKKWRWKPNDATAENQRNSAQSAR